MQAGRVLSQFGSPPRLRPVFYHFPKPVPGLAIETAIGRSQLPSWTAQTASLPWFYFGQVQQRLFFLFPTNLFYSTILALLSSPPGLFLAQWPIAPWPPLLQTPHF